MKKIFFSSIGFVAFAMAIAINIKASINDHTESYLSLSTIESVAIAGCEASATSCTATCTGSSWCISGSTHVNCDGTFTYCSNL